MTAKAGYTVPPPHTAYRWWGDKTSYLKNVNCSEELKNMAAITCKSMETANFHLSFVASFLQMGIWIGNYLEMLRIFNKMTKTQFHQNLSYKVLSSHQRYVLSPTSF